MRTPESQASPSLYRVRLNCVLQDRRLISRQLGNALTDLPRLVHDSVNRTLDELNQIKGDEESDWNRASARILSQPEVLRVLMPWMCEFRGDVLESQDPNARQMAVDRGMSVLYQDANASVPVAFQERRDRSRLIARLVYPCFVAAFCLTLLIFLSRTVIAEFERMFDDFGLMIPTITRAALIMASFLSDYGSVCIIALFLIGLALFFWVRTGRELPVIGLKRHGRKEHLASFAEDAARLVESGFPLADSIELAGMTSSDPRLRHASQDWARVIRRNGNSSGGGDALGGVVRWDRVPTALLFRALSTPCEAHERSRSLRFVASSYRNRYRSDGNWYFALLSQSILIVVGMLVGFTVVALFSPLISLVSALS